MDPTKYINDDEALTDIDAIIDKLRQPVIPTPVDTVHNPFESPVKRYLYLCFTETTYNDTTFGFGKYTIKDYEFSTTDSAEASKWLANKPANDSYRNVMAVDAAEITEGAVYTCFEHRRACNWFKAYVGTTFTLDQANQWTKDRRPNPNVFYTFEVHNVKL